MSRRYLRKLSRRCAPVPLRPGFPALVDPFPVALGLGLAGLLVALAGWS